MSIGGRIRLHFDTHRRRAKWPFFWRVTFEALVIKVLVLIVLASVWRDSVASRFAGYSPTKLIVFACLVAPVLETIILQVFPVFIARALGARFWIQVMVSAVLFAAAHFLDGFGVGVAAGVIGGFYLAFTYTRWREESLTVAFGMTAGTHAVRNGLIVAVGLLANVFSP